MFSLNVTSLPSASHKHSIASWLYAVLLAVQLLAFGALIYLIALYIRELLRLGRLWRIENRARADQYDGSSDVSEGSYAV